MQELARFSNISEGPYFAYPWTTFNHAGASRTVLWNFFHSFETFMVNLEAFIFGRILLSITKL